MRAREGLAHTHLPVGQLGERGLMARCWPRASPLRAAHPTVCVRARAAPRSLCVFLAGSVTPCAPDTLLKAPAVSTSGRERAPHCRGTDAAARIPRNNGFYEPNYIIFYISARENRAPNLCTYEGEPRGTAPWRCFAGWTPQRRLTGPCRRHPPPRPHPASSNRRRRAAWGNGRALHTIFNGW